MFGSVSSQQPWLRHSPLLSNLIPHIYYWMPLSHSLQIIASCILSPTPDPPPTVETLSARRKPGESSFLRLHFASAALEPTAVPNSQSNLSKRGPCPKALDQTYFIYASQPFQLPIMSISTLRTIHVQHKRMCFYETMKSHVYFVLVGLLYAWPP